MKRGLFLLFVFVGTAVPWLKSYEVQPVKAAWSGKVRGDEDYGVGQTIVCNFDSAVAVDLFVGDTSEGGWFDAEIRDYETGMLVAKKEGVHATQGHAWLRFYLEPVSGQKFVRGKEYLVKFTRPGDSIQFYYDPNNPYHYGQIKIGGGGFQPPPQPVEYCDLCLRCYGVLRPENLGACKTPATA